MCVIVIKPAGKTLPAKKELHACWERNPDGAGYAYRENGMVKWSKGHMTFKAFWKSISAIPAECFNEAMIVHFRIATHSVKDGGNTHPFPITDQFDLLRAEDGETDGFVMAHNGIISGMPADAALSDSMVFVRDIAFKNQELFVDKDRNELIVKLILQTNKLVFMSPTEIVTIGDWTDENGLLWSNTYHRTVTVSYYGNGRKGGYSGKTQPSRQDLLDQYIEDGFFDDDTAEWMRGNRKREGYKGPYCATCILNGPNLGDSDPRKSTCGPCWAASTRINHVARVRRPAYELTSGSTSYDGLRRKCDCCKHHSTFGSSTPCATCYFSNGYKNWEPVPTVETKAGTKLDSSLPGVRPSGDIGCGGCIYIKIHGTDEPCKGCLASSGRPKKTLGSITVVPEPRIEETTHNNDAT